MDRRQYGPYEMVASLVAQLGEPQVVELTALAALENYRSRFNHGLGITARGFTSGAACAVPVGAAQAAHRP